MLGLFPVMMIRQAASLSSRTLMGRGMESLELAGQVQRTGGDLHLPIAKCQRPASIMASFEMPWSRATISASGVDLETEVCFLLTAVIGM